MLPRTAALTAASLVFACSSCALAGIGHGPGETIQYWSFLTPSFPTPPDPQPFHNPNGVPTFVPKGQPQWLPTWPSSDPFPKQGVWCVRPFIPGVPPDFQDSLNFIVPNYDDPEPKIITVQYKWWSDAASAPGLGGAVNVILPDGTNFFNGLGSTVPDLPDHPGWWITTHTITLPYCPPFEEIKIFNHPENQAPMYVDWVCINTICIPSPGSMAVMGLAGLVAARRRR